MSRRQLKKGVCDNNLGVEKLFDFLKFVYPSLNNKGPFGIEEKHKTFEGFHSCIKFSYMTVLYNIRLNLIKSFEIPRIHP
jgi:hypothetical protein